MKKLKMIGVLLLCLGLSILVGFRIKLYTDGIKQAAIKENFLALCASYQEKAKWNEDDDYYIGNMEEFTALTGETIAIIDIPAIDLSVSVVEGVEKEDIKLSIGHFPQTDMPWIKGGNFAVAGHSSIVYNCLFNNLHDAEVGMNVSVTTKYGTYYYTISEIKVVDPTDVSILEKPDGDTSIITMTTCINSGKQRLIVIGTMNR